MHTFPDKVDKGHEIQAFVRDLSFPRRYRKVRLKNLVRRFEMGPAS
jgi:hypothetical protein